VNDVFDIAVVGAGPAGSVAAALLARGGRRVVLFDKATFPRRKVCGCCLNGLALSSLAAAGMGGLAAQLGAVPLSGVRLATGGRTARVRLPGGVALSREALDTALVSVAATAGAEVRTGVRVRLGEGTTTGWTVQVGAAEVRAGLVLDATGINGHLTSTGAAVAADSRIGAGTVLDAAAGYPAGDIYMATGGGGYVGLVRLEDGRLDVAAAFDPAFVRTAGGLGQAAVRVLHTSGLPPLPELREGEWRGTPPLSRTPRTVAGLRWFAIGDATGYVEPFTGEGMAWALASAVAVVPLVHRALGGWDPRHAAEWAATHRRVVGRRQTTCRIAARVLRSPTSCGWIVRGLRLLPALATPFVRMINHPLPRVR
jgi:flavin-dependent dehydrogenase